MGTASAAPERTRLDPVERRGRHGDRAIAGRFSRCSSSRRRSTTSIARCSAFSRRRCSAISDGARRDYGNIVSWFSFAYGIGMLGMGRLLDRIGTRRGFSLAIVVVERRGDGDTRAPRPAAAFSVARGLLGLGESGNFPAVDEDGSPSGFRRSERALAVGIFNAGSNVGAIIAPIAVPWIALTWGWQRAFVATGAHRVHLADFLAARSIASPTIIRRLDAAELAHIRSDPAESRRRASRGCSCCAIGRHGRSRLGKALTDPVWLFYLFWLPKFLDARLGREAHRRSPRRSSPFI